MITTTNNALKHSNNSKIFTDVAVSPEIFGYIKLAKVLTKNTNNKSLSFHALSLALNTLAERERYVIFLNYGLESSPVSLRSIALSMNLSRERVRQIRTLALARLKVQQINYSSNNFYNLYKKLSDTIPANEISINNLPLDGQTCKILHSVEVNSLQDFYYFPTSSKYMGIKKLQKIFKKKEEFFKLCNKILEGKKTEISLEEIGLSVRAISYLKRRHITNFENLLNTPKHILKETSYNEIRAVEEIVLRRRSLITLFKIQISSPDELEPLEVSIKSLNLSIRATNALASERILTLGELLKISSSELSSIRNIGIKTVNELLNKQSEYMHLIKDETTTSSPTDVYITDLDFSTRATNALLRSKIVTLTDLLKTPEDQILLIRNIGQVTFSEIINKKKLLQQQFCNI